MDGSCRNNPTAASTPPSVVAVPPGAPAWITPELIADTLKVWQPFYANQLTSADALQILLTTAHLFETLDAKDEQQAIPGAGPRQQP